MRSFLSAIVLAVAVPLFSKKHHLSIKSTPILQVICVFLLCIFYTEAAHAGEGDMPPDGKLLGRVCQSENLYDQGFCNGYIVGVATSNEHSPDRSNAPSRPTGFCLAGKIFSQTDLKNIVLSYIVRNRSRVENIDAKYSVIRALEEAYPCH
ncbi:MAG: Rap1a/Tai family immunity protein [Thermodesulfobacteriota bacterium]